jgi:hypothetical protein
MKPVFKKGDELKPYLPFYMKNLQTKKINVNLKVADNELTVGLRYPPQYQGTCGRLDGATATFGAQTKV